MFHINYHETEIANFKCSYRFNIEMGKKKVRLIQNLMSNEQSPFIFNYKFF